ncbi:hypothetical protein BOTBODRAFT_64831 [Botryobasidium botryosum FD-172 SS1]|uniref:DUF6533 domain-containing protein n=1 Tax=Botryobasidium botryosum (strain FD-172 SS1) TaxID=930990 RepID=A0A067MPC0_BOTB1|nr:hypothetical protein BOTBODRAFT_64831 [Botryobasidium botryosum FD-172 SS1]
MARGFDGFYWPSFICLLYDHALTFDSEVNLVWRAPSNFVKWLFLFTRYFTPTILATLYSAVSIRDINSYHKVQLVLLAIISVVPLGCADFMLLLRVYALWQRNQVVLILSLFVYFASYTTITVFTVSVLWPNYFYFNGQSRAPFLALAVCSLIFDIWAVTMTLIKAIQHSRTRRIQNPLMATVLRDGILYYVAVITIKTMAAVAPSVAQYSNADMMEWVEDIFIIVTALSVTLTSRIFLNLRGVHTAEDWACTTNIRGGSDHLSEDYSSHAPQYSLDFG